MDYDIDAINQEELNKLIDDLKYKNISVIESEINRNGKSNIILGLDNLSLVYCEKILEILKQYSQVQMRIFNIDGFMYALISSPIDNSKDFFSEISNQLNKKSEKKEALENYALKSAYEISKIYLDTNLSAATIFEKKSIEENKYDFILYNSNDLKKQPIHKKLSTEDLLNYCYDSERRNIR